MIAKLGMRATRDGNPAPQWARAYRNYLLVRMAFCLIQALPLETNVRLVRLAAWLIVDVFNLFRLRQKVVDDNLRHAFPDLSAAQRRDLAREIWVNLLLSIVEIALAPRKIHKSNWQDFIDVKDADALLQIQREGRGVLLTSAHFGNFEIANYALGVLGLTTYAVARPFVNPYLDRLQNQFRRLNGKVVISNRGSYRRVPEILDAGGIMIFLADQYAGPKGCWVNFFGREASTHSIVARLSRKHQAPIVVGYARRTRPLHFEMRIHAISDPRTCSSSAEELTQWYTARLEECIRLAPEQYWWFHRRWKDPRVRHRNHLKRFLFYKEAHAWANTQTSLAD